MSTTKSQKPARKPMNGMTMYKSNIKETKDHVTIKFPKDILQYLKLSGPNVFWVPVNGTIQILGVEQQIALPLMPIDTDSFVPQTV